MYTAEVIERFRNPKNVGKLKDYNCIGKAGNPECSDVIEMRIKITKNKIQDAKFLVYGCPGAVSTTDAFIDLILGKEIKEALNISQDDISKELGNLPMTHFHCSKLPIEAFKNAVDSFRKN